jgi:class 3 adenylate cyclase
MKCPHCGAAARSGTLFCEQCGSKLEKVCPKCAAMVPVEARFCGVCGQATAEPSGPPGRAEAPHKHLAAAAASPERRHITVMFCDVVGSTALSERLDPEHLRDVLRTYQNICADAIARFDGHLAKYIGDGILAYFGYPRAHDDDARRAVHAGLRICRDIEHLKTDDLDRLVRVAVRIGIHTGLVVAGEMGAGAVRESHAIVGETPNLAARLQELAAPNTVLLSEATFHLIERYFECRPLGPHALKGLVHPVSIFEACSVRAEPERDRHVLPIGRDEELAFLLGRWQRVSDNEGQAVLLSGEAGIGKSCLLDALKDRVIAERGLCRACQCSPYGKNSVLQPAVDFITRALKLTDEQQPPEKLAKIETALRRYDLATPENVAIYAALLSIPVDGNYRLPEMTPAERRQRIMGALLAWLTAEAEAQKMLFIVEDLHWVDASTADFLGLVLEQLATLPILAVFAFRPEFMVPWPPRSHISTLALGRLGPEAAQAITARVSGRKRLPSPVIEQILAKTDGIPLFVEELTKMVLGSGLLIEQDDQYQLAGALPPLAIPTTLRDSLMARLDRLGRERHAMQMAAVFGREFGFQMLQVALGTDSEALERDLAALVRAEMLYRRGLPPAATYFFKHALIHDTAYPWLCENAAA